MIEQDDIVEIRNMDDGHCAFWCKSGECFCSCGWSERDQTYVWQPTGDKS